MSANISRQRDLSRRSFLKAGGTIVATAAAAQTLRASTALGQSPKRGGTLSLRLWDPPHFDPHLIVAYKTHIIYSFTHSRLVKHKAGPSVQPGTFSIEGDLAESWTQPNETTYVFKLRSGIRWHTKPPVNGRELTAEDIVYSVERFRTVKGNANAYMLTPVDKVGGPVYVAVCIVAAECVEKWGDLKRSEATVGTGPWMFDSYRPNQGLTLVRNPHYFVPGLPYIDRIEIFVDEDNASRMSAFLGGKYDIGWENPGHINRTDWVQIKDTLKQRRPNLKTAEFAGNVVTGIFMRTDKAPFSDARVRQAMSMAIDGRGAQVLWPEPRLRLGRASHGRLARPLTASSGKKRRGRFPGCLVEHAIQRHFVLRPQVTRWRHRPVALEEDLRKRWLRSETPPPIDAADLLSPWSFGSSRIPVSERIWSSGSRKTTGLSATR